MINGCTDIVVGVYDEGKEAEVGWFGAACDNAATARRAGGGRTGVAGRQSDEVIDGESKSSTKPECSYWIGYPRPQNLGGSSAGSVLLGEVREILLIVEKSMKVYCVVHVIDQEGRFSSRLRQHRSIKLALKTTSSRGPKFHLAYGSLPEHRKHQDSSSIRSTREQPSP